MLFLGTVKPTKKIFSANGKTAQLRAIFSLFIFATLTYPQAKQKFLFAGKTKRNFKSMLYFLLHFFPDEGGLARRNLTSGLRYFIFLRIKAGMSHSSSLPAIGLTWLEKSDIFLVCAAGISCFIAASVLTSDGWRRS